MKGRRRGYSRLENHPDDRHVLGDISEGQCGEWALDLREGGAYLVNVIDGGSLTISFGCQSDFKYILRAVESKA